MYFMFSCYLGCRIRNEIWGSHSGVAEDSFLLGCGTVSLVSCWDVALCRWSAVGMWHCVVQLLGCGVMSLVSGSLHCEEV